VFAVRRTTCAAPAAGNSQAAADDGHGQEADVSPPLQSLENMNDLKFVRNRFFDEAELFHQ
jgi:hypothetical protein